MAAYVEGEQFTNLSHQILTRGNHTCNPRAGLGRCSAVQTVAGGVFHSANGCISQVNPDDMSS